MKNLVKFDDRYFTVAMIEGTPVMKEATPEEIVAHEFENMVILKDETIDTSMFQEIIDQTKMEMHRQLKDSLQTLVLGMMGFNRSSNGFYVSGLNDKNGSPVSNMLAEQLKKRLLEVELKKDFDLTPLEKTKLKAAMKVSYKEAYESEVRRVIYEMAKNEARSHAKDAIQEFAKDKLKTAAVQIVEQAIRKSGTTIGKD